MLAVVPERVKLPEPVLVKLPEPLIVPAKVVELLRPPVVKVPAPSATLAVEEAAASEPMVSVFPLRLSWPSELMVTAEVSAIWLALVS